MPGFFRRRVLRIGHADAKAGAAMVIRLPVAGGSAPVLPAAVAAAVFGLCLLGGKAAALVADALGVIAAALSAGIALFARSLVGLGAVVFLPVTHALAEAPAAVGAVAPLLQPVGIAVSVLLQITSYLLKSGVQILYPPAKRCQIGGAGRQHIGADIHALPGGGGKIRSLDIGQHFFRFPVQPGAGIYLRSGHFKTRDGKTVHIFYKVRQLAPAAPFGRAGLHIFPAGKIGEAEHGNIAGKPAADDIIYPPVLQRVQ